MKKIDSTCVGVWVVLLGAMIFPICGFAANMTFDVQGSTDTATVIDVRIDPLAKKINAIDGTLKLDGLTKNQSVEILTDTSVLTIWPTPPQYTASDSTIRFTGGVPNGFDHESLLFRIRLTSSEKKDSMISWIGGTAYLNDGKGTKEAVFAKPFTMTVEKNISNETKRGVGDTTGGLYGIIILSIAIISAAFAFYVHKKNTAK